MIFENEITKKYGMEITSHDKGKSFCCVMDIGEGSVCYWCENQYDGISRLLDSFIVDMKGGLTKYCRDKFEVE